MRLECQVRDYNGEASPRGYYSDFDINVLTQIRVEDVGAILTLNITMGLVDSGLARQE